MRLSREARGEPRPSSIHPGSRADFTDYITARQRATDVHTASATVFFARVGGCVHTAVQLGYM